MSRKPNQYILQKKSQLHKEVLLLKQYSNQLLKQYERCKFSGGLVFFSTNDEQVIASTYKVLNNTFPKLKEQAKELLTQLELTEKMLRRAYNPKNSFPNKNIMNEATIRFLKKKLNEVIHTCVYCLEGTHKSADISRLDVNAQTLQNATANANQNSIIQSIQKNKESFQNHFGLNTNYAGILLNAHLLMSSIQKSKTTLRTLSKI